MVFFALSKVGKRLILENYVLSVQGQEERRPPEPTGSSSWDEKADPSLGTSESWSPGGRTGAQLKTPGCWLQASSLGVLSSVLAVSGLFQEGASTGCEQGFSPFLLISGEGSEAGVLSIARVNNLISHA